MVRISRLLENPRTKPPLHESNVAGLFNLAAGPVENTPEHKALEAEQGFGYRSVLGIILFAYALCQPDVSYVCHTLFKVFCSSKCPTLQVLEAFSHLFVTNSGLGQRTLAILFRQASPGSVMCCFGVC